MKKILLGTAAVGAVVIVAAWFMGFPPSSDGTEGTVGAANRYQGAQMTSKDVKLGSTDVQNFIQSDVFAKLVRDPKARETLKRIGSDAAFRDLMLNNAWLDAMRNTDVEAAFEGGAAAMFAEPAFMEMLQFKSFAEAAKNPDFLEMLASPVFVDTMRKAGGSQQEYFNHAAKNPELENALNDKVMRAAFEDQAAYKVMNNPSFLNAIAKPGFVEMMKNPAIGEAFNKPAFVEMCRNPEVARLFKNPAFGEYFKNPAVADAFKNPAFMDAMQNAAYVDAMRNPGFESAFTEAAADRGR